MEEHEGLLRRQLAMFVETESWLWVEGGGGGENGSVVVSKSVEGFGQRKFSKINGIISAAATMRLQCAIRRWMAGRGIAGVRKGRCAIELQRVSHSASRGYVTHATPCHRNNIDMLTRISTFPRQAWLQSPWCAIRCYSLDSLPYGENNCNYFCSIAFRSI